MSIQDEISRLDAAKADIKAAIEGRGVTVPDTTRINGMAELISGISGGATNLINGSAVGSLRSVGSTVEDDNYTIGEDAVAFGNLTKASGQASYAEGLLTSSTGLASHAEGYDTKAKGFASHAEGRTTTASGGYSHAEGYYTFARGEYSHAEGYLTIAGDSPDGGDTVVSGDYSHAEGHSTYALGDASHAEGYSTIASGEYSHAEGRGTVARGKHSHAEGTYTYALRKSQHVEGEYNILDEQNGTDYESRGKYVHIVGNGEEGRRSNAHTIDWDGNAWYQGRIKIGGTGWDDATDEVAYKSDLEGLGGGSISDNDILAALIETDSLPAITTLAGAILTDSNGNIILRY